MESKRHSIPVLSAAETERIRRTPGRSGHPLCGIVIGSSWHEPVACAYPPDHTGDHSWASIPQFDPRKELEEQFDALRDAAHVYREHEESEPDIYRPRDHSEWGSLLYEKQAILDRVLASAGATQATETGNEPARVAAAPAEDSSPAKEPRA